VSSPGIYVRGATVALTRRTTMRKAFLAPWHELVEHIRLWFLAVAQVETGVEIHASHDVVSHHHTRVTPTDDNLPDFLRIVHGETSRALNTLLAREGYDAPGEIFDDRPTHQMRLLDAEAQASHHVYEHLNTVAAGLVARPELMPGLKLSHEQWKSSGPLVVPRPPIYVDPRRSPAELPLHITPDPELYAAFDGDLAALTHHLDRLVDHGLRRVRDARRGRRPLGAKAVRRIHPWSEPRTLRETRGQPVSTFKAGASDILGVELEVAAAGEVTRFRAEHREARIARREGDLDAAYPYGTYAARVYEGAPVEPVPRSDAVLAKPGRTLEEVKEQLAERDSVDPEERRAARRRLVDEVKAAWSEEAPAVVAHDDLELCRKVAVSGAGEDAAKADAPDAAPGGVEVRHRLDRRPEGRSSAARIVTLRDGRRGRPRRSDEPGGSDPPG
jgi:hypothetical protein